MEQLTANHETEIQTADLTWVLGGIEIANQLIESAKRSGFQSGVKQYQYMKWKHAKEIRELLTDFRLPVRLVKFDIKQPSGGYPVIENGDLKPDFDTEAFLDILDEIAELNKDLRKTRNGNAAFFKEKKLELTKNLLAMLDVYCLPLELREAR